MPPVNFPPCPPNLKSVQHYLKLANDYENRNSAISYWARLYALQVAMKIDKSSAEAKMLLIAIMDYLEKFKKEHAENEGVTSDIAGQALVENEAHKLFMKADSADRQSFYDKNIVKAFYTAGILMDVCEVFGELTDELAAQRKYSKWKATYIHNCLKKGETPVPGPIGGEENLTFDIPQPPSGQDIPEENFPSIPSDTDQASYQPPVQPVVETPSPNIAPQSDGSLTLTTEQFTKAQKYCKYAISSLDYQDTETAVDYLQKALTLLTTGRDS